MTHLIIGSSFSALGTIHSLLSLKKKNIFLINSSNKKIGPSKKNYKIKLISRNFNKYNKEINSSYEINKIISQKKNNFISYLGEGGLSNIWGKLLNTQVEENIKNINIIKEKLKLKEKKIIYSNKNFLLFKNQENNINPLKLLKSLAKKKLIKIINTSFVEKITFNKIKKKFEIFIYKKKIYAKKIYLASGFFSNIKFINDLIGEKNFKQPIKINHKEMLYGFFLNTKKFFLKKGNEKEFFFLDKKHKYFSGRIINLQKYHIKKYNLNPIFYFILFIFNLFGFNIFLFNFFYKKKKQTNLFLKNNEMVINSSQTILSNNYLKIFKKKYDNYFNFKFIYAIKTYTGSDFHYTSNIKNNIKNLEKYPAFKNLYICGGSCIKKNYFFPTFYFILNSFFNIKKDINFYKI